jgi:hypothetical protein
MPLEKLTADQLSGDRRRRRAGNREYIAFLRSLRIGQGGRATVEAEGITRQGIKVRLKTAAQEAGVVIQFIPSSANEVLFQVVGKPG